MHYAVSGSDLLVTRQTGKQDYFRDLLMGIRARHLLFLVAVCSADLVHAQCTSPIELGPPISLCAGQSQVLSAPSGYQSYVWNTGANTPSITVSAAGTYSCTVTQTGTNAITNGDFSAGATGFTSDYVPGTGGTYGLLSAAGTYATTTSPNFVHNNFAAFGDHTTGSGAMLVMNGTQVIGQNIWCQTVTVAPNTTYTFSAWLASAVSASPAQLQYTVNGVPIGNLNASSVLGLWVNFTSTWNSGAATTATLCITNLNTAESGNDFAIDDIAFVPLCTYTDNVVVTVYPLPTPDLGPDQEYCAGNAVALNPQVPGADSYLWQNGSSAPTLTPTASGVYWVDVTDNGCTTRDSVLVNILTQPTISLGPDQQLCQGQVTVLNAFYPGATVLWNDGSTVPTRTVSQSGTYWVIVDLAGCVDRDTVALIFHPLPIVELGNDTSICEVDALVLDVYRPGGSYLWENGSTLPQRTTTGAGTYRVVVVENGCATADSLSLSIIPLPEAYLGPDRLLCAGRTEELDVYRPGCTYLWNDGSTGPTRIVSGPGMYAVTVTNSCGTASDDVEFDLDFCDCPVYTPNAFTANGDEINDRFVPQFTCPNRSYLLRIYDRWGRIQWESTDMFKEWDGAGLPQGVYAWTIEYEPDSDVLRGTRTASGHVVLVR